MFIACCFNQFVVCIICLVPNVHSAYLAIYTNLSRVDSTPKCPFLPTPSTIPWTTFLWGYMSMHNFPAMPNVTVILGHFGSSSCLAVGGIFK